MVDDAPVTRSDNVRVDRRRVASQRSQDRGRQRLAFFLIGFFLLMILGIFIAGYVIIFVLPPREVVVRVNDVQYTRGDMVKHLRVTQKRLELMGGQLDVSTDLFLALQSFVEDEIISQAAPRFGVNVSDELLDAEIRRTVLPFEAISEGKDPAQIDREFQEAYRSFLNVIQLSEAEHRRLVRKLLLRDVFREFIGEAVPTVAEQVHLHRVAVTEGDEVDIMLVKLADAIGDSRDPDLIQREFKLISKEFSREQGEVVRRGGDLGWVPEGVYPEYDAYFFDLDVGKVSDAALNSDNSNQFYFFLLSERQTARELDPEDRKVLKDRALQDWLNAERESNDVFSKFNSDTYGWMLEQLQLTTIRTPEPQRTNPLGF